MVADRNPSISWVMSMTVCTMESRTMVRLVDHSLWQMFQIRLCPNHLFTLQPYNHRYAGWYRFHTMVDIVHDCLYLSGADNRRQFSVCLQPFGLNTIGTRRQDPPFTMNRHKLNAVNKLTYFRGTHTYWKWNQCHDPHDKCSVTLKIMYGIDEQSP